MSTWVKIRRVNRISPSMTVASAEAADGPIEVRDVVGVIDIDTGKIGGALVVAAEDGFIYLSVSWPTLFAWPTQAQIAEFAKRVRSERGKPPMITSNSGKITPPYSPDDDPAADDYINRALRSPEAMDMWRGLADPVYAEQTLRVLRFFSDQLELTFTQRDREVAAAWEAFMAEKISRSEFDRTRTSYDEWVPAATHFRSLVARHWDYVEAAALRVRSQATGPADQLRAAIEAHERSIRGLGEKPRKADRQLWRIAAQVRPSADLPLTDWMQGVYSGMRAEAPE